MRVTIIDFSASVDAISNLEQLPIAVREMLNQATDMRRCGFQEILGFGQDLSFSAGGYYINGRFQMTSIGWKTSQGWWGWTPKKGIYACEGTKG